MSSTKGICARIKAECRRQNRTLRDVMKDAGLGLSTFYMWKGAGNIPKRESLTSVAGALKMTVDDLLAGVEVVDAKPEEPAHRPGKDSNDDEVVVVAMRRQSLELLRPFIFRAAPDLFEMPSDINRSLVQLLGLRTQPLR